MPDRLNLDHGVIVMLNHLVEMVVLFHIETTIENPVLLMQIAQRFQAYCTAVGMLGIVV
ncbi:hypothetical protein D3C84_1164680 [compost metagenome]